MSHGRGYLQGSLIAEDIFTTPGEGRPFLQTESVHVSPMMGPNPGNRGRLTVAELVQDEVLFFGRFAAHPAAKVTSKAPAARSVSVAAGYLEAWRLKACWRHPVKVVLKCRGWYQNDCTGQG